LRNKKRERSKPVAKFRNLEPSERNRCGCAGVFFLQVTSYKHCHDCAKLPHKTFLRFARVDRAPVPALAATSSGLKSTLLKAMPLAEVQAGEALAKSYQPGHTVIQVRNAVIIPNLKLTGLASSGGDRIAIINGTRFVAGKSAQLNVDGYFVSVRCIRIDDKAAVVSMPPENTTVTLHQGSAPVVSP